ncbi:hypothetical protein CWI38_0431p0010 [Hamiltosporidium tvaerminnensis]|uniref:Uncharacterized protein n=1 Tax=Hamiltosporidium tvaerminnensis TaxID=1176355 RepID=A0A4Q9LYR5_9MICR|nr:hypothetical protein CWI38_0431p0010 [Hamiltosporidium tvaerminnensis]
MPNIESDETFSMQAVGNNPCLDSDQRTISECSHFQPAYYRSKNTENFLSFSQRTSNKERDKMSRDSINLSKMGNNAKEQLVEEEPYLDSEKFVIPEFSSLTSDVVKEELLVLELYSTPKDNTVAYIQNGTEIDVDRTKSNLKRGNDANSYDIRWQRNDSFISDDFSEHSNKRPRVNKKARSSDIGNRDASISSDSHNNPCLYLPECEPICCENNHEDTKIASYINQFKIRIYADEMIVCARKCSTYFYYLNLVPELYLELNNLFKIKKPNEFPSNNQNYETDLRYNNYLIKIKNEIKKYDSVDIGTNEMIEEIVIFANYLVEFEKTISSDFILKENNYILYVYFLLSVISKQFDNFDKNFSLEYKRCVITNKICENNCKSKYLQKLFVQKLFFRLLLGMKAGRTKASFYNVYLSLELNDKGYLRICVSVVLNLKCELDINQLDRFINLSLEIFTLKSTSKKIFTDEIKLFIYQADIHLIVKKNLMIIKEISDKKRIYKNCRFIDQSLIYLKNRIKSEPINGLINDDIVLSEICLVYILSESYINNNFEGRKKPPKMGRSILFD